MKAKKFSKKLLALFLAVVMALTALTGAFSAYGKTGDSYYDNDIYANILNWVELTDEQTLTALIDYADEMLASVDAHTSVSLSVLGTLYIDIDSVNGILYMIDQIYDMFDGGLVSAASTLGLIGDLKNLDFDTAANLEYVDGGNSACGRDYTSTMKARDVILTIFNLLLQNFVDTSSNGKNILRCILQGDFDLGTIVGNIIEDNFGSDNIYDLINGIIGTSASYDSSDTDTGFLYEILQELIVDAFYPDTTSDEHAAAMELSLDTLLFKLLSEDLLQLINVCVTYSDGTTSKTRLEEINACIEEDNGYNTYATAAAHLGYDPNLVYSEENEGNILLFVYGDNKLEVTVDDSLFDIALEALPLAWDTVLNDTLSLLHVNSNIDRGHGANFDNQYYYWVKANIDGGWDTTDLTTMYSYVDQWAEAVYADYSASSADEFLEWVQETLVYSRDVLEDATYSWKDIDPTTLFGMLRYSPLADYAFDMQTGPINLYLAQTGCTNLESFFANDLSSYSSVLSGLNDALVAAVYDLFPQSDNIDGTRPTLTQTIASDASAATVATALVNNAAQVFQYAADSANKNILSKFYNTYGSDAVLSETNFEEACVPLLVSCIQEITMTEPIHDEKWDACNDAEAVAYVVLEEYLSYVLPDKDYSGLVTTDDDGYYVADLTTTILPMVRDALGYIIQSSVPILTVDSIDSGECDTALWNAYTSAVDSDVTIWDIFNSILLYYANHTGVAALLGVVDTSGNSLITSSNTLWENIDVIANKFLPVLGTLQYGSTSSEGSFSSYDLIYNDIIQGVLNIGDTNNTTGYQGITNFLYRLLTILSASPISEDSLDCTVYTLLAQIINGIFGARYEGQGYVQVVPTLDDLSALGKDTSNPFDAVVTVDVLATYYYGCSEVTRSGDGDGIFGSLFYNICEFFGGGICSSQTSTVHSSYYTSATNGVEGCWDGLAYIIQAVNSFIPSFVPQIGAAELGSGYAYMDTSAVSGINSGDIASYTLYFENESLGVNRFADEGTSEYGRYYFDVTGVTTSNDNITVDTSSGLVTLAPGETTSFPVSVTYASGTQATALTVTYDVYLSTVTSSGVTEKGTLLYEGLTSQANFYSTTEFSWFTNTYDSSTGYFWEDTNTANDEWYGQDETTVTAKSTAAGGTDNNVVMGYPTQVVLDENTISNNLSSVNVRLRNNGTSTFGSKDRAVDGVFAYPDVAENVYVVTDGTLATTTTDVTVDSSNRTDYAYAAFDAETGDILNYDLYDYSLDGGQTWERGTVQDTGVYGGYTWNEMWGESSVTVDGTTYANLNEAYGDTWVYRYHHALTFDEGLSTGIITAVDRTETSDGYLYNQIYVTTSTDLLKGNYEDNSKESITYATPINGLTFAMAKTVQAKNSSTYVKFLRYDDSIDLTYQDITCNVLFYTTNNTNMTAEIEFVTVSTAAASTLQSSYDELSNWLSTYQASDFASADTYSTVQSKLTAALEVISTPITKESAADIADDTEVVATTNSTTSFFGDRAYEPYSGDLPASLMYSAEADGDYWIWNGTASEYIYGNELETSASSTYTATYNGTAYTVGYNEVGALIVYIPDGAFEDVEAGWYFLNEEAYEYAWDTTTYSTPYYGPTDTLATDSNGNQLYNQKEFVYRNESGDKVTSKDSSWVYKLVDCTTRIKINDGNDYRGAYSRAIDMLEYYQEIAKADVSTASVEQIIKLTAYRQGLNNVNYDVVTYEQMVKLAQAAEKLVSYSYAVYNASDVTEVVEGSGVYLANSGATALESTDDGYDEGVSAIDPDSFSTSYSSAQLTNAYTFWSYYYNDMVSRNYTTNDGGSTTANNGRALEAEVVCASGNDYTAFDTSWVSTASDDDTTTPSATVTGTATDVDYGAMVDGVLVNEGDIVYTDDSWADYVDALATAIDTCDESDAKISTIYTVKTALQIAENNLTEATADTVTITVPTVENVTAITVNGTEYSEAATVEVEAGSTVTLSVTAADGYNVTEITVNGTALDLDDPSFTATEDVTIAVTVEAATSDTITVSGTIYIATDTAGTASSYGLVGITVAATDDDGTTYSATSAEDGTFTLEVPVGTTSLTVDGDTCVPRTVTLTGTQDITDAQIGIVMADYNHNGLVNVLDTSAYASYIGSDYVYADYNANGVVNVLDTSQYSKFIGMTADSYAALNLG